MRVFEFKFKDETYPLCLNGAALFAIYDKYGSDVSVFDPIKEMDSKGFEAICFYLHELAKQGEIIRRWEGRMPRKIPPQAMFAAMLDPHEVNEARQAIRETLALGFARDHDDREKIDLGLEELRKKAAAD